MEGETEGGSGKKILCIATERRSQLSCQIQDGPGTNHELDKHIIALHAASYWTCKTVVVVTSTMRLSNWQGNFEFLEKTPFISQ